MGIITNNAPILAPIPLPPSAVQRKASKPLADELLPTITPPSPDTALARLKEKEAELRGIRAELEKLGMKEKAVNMKVSPEALELVFSAWLKDLEEVMGSGNVLGMKEFLARFVSKVELGYNRAVIHYTYPLGELCGINSNRVGGTK